MPVADTRKYLDGLRSALTRNIVEKKYTRIPDLVNLRIKNVRARKAGLVMLRGKTWPAKAVAAGERKIVGAAAKELLEALVG